MWLLYLLTQSATSSHLLPRFPLHPGLYLGMLACLNDITRVRPMGGADKRSSVEGEQGKDMTPGSLFQLHSSPESLSSHPGSHLQRQLPLASGEPSLPSLFRSGMVQTPMSPQSASPPLADFPLTLPGLS